MVEEKLKAIANQLVSVDEKSILFILSCLNALNIQYTVSEEGSIYTQSEIGLKIIDKVDEILDIVEKQIQNKVVEVFNEEVFAKHEYFTKYSE
jgi:hypothetical protein